MHFKALLGALLVAPATLLPQSAHAAASIELVEVADRQFEAQLSQLTSPFGFDAGVVFPDLDNLGSYANQGQELAHYGNRFSALGAPITATSVDWEDVVIAGDSTSAQLAAVKISTITIGGGDATSDLEYRSQVVMDFAGGKLLEFTVMAEDGRLTAWDDGDFRDSEVETPVVGSARSRGLISDGGGWVPVMSPSQKALAVAYALTWSNSDPASYFHNPAYGRFDSDCTNFISQALFAGGWKTIGNGSFGDRESLGVWGFWERDLSPLTFTTRTWTGADYLYRFALRSGRGAAGGTVDKTQLVSWTRTLEPGDLIFMTWSGGPSNEKDHVMMVTSNAGGVIRISQHSANRRNFSISEHLDVALEDHPNPTWFVVRT